MRCVTAPRASPPLFHHPFSSLLLLCNPLEVLIRLALSKASSLPNRSASRSSSSTWGDFLRGEDEHRHFLCWLLTHTVQGRV